MGPTVFTSHPKEATIVVKVTWKYILFVKVVPTSDRETMHRMSRSSSVPAPFIESYIRSAKNTAGLLARATAI